MTADCTVQWQLRSKRRKCDKENGGLGEEGKIKSERKRRESRQRMEGMSVKERSEH